MQPSSGDVSESSSAEEMVRDTEKVETHSVMEPQVYAELVAIRNKMKVSN